MAVTTAPDTEWASYIIYTIKMITHHADGFSFVPVNTLCYLSSRCPTTGMQALAWLWQSWLATLSPSSQVGFHSLTASNQRGIHHQLVSFHLQVPWIPSHMIPNWSFHCLTASVAVSHCVSGRNVGSVSTMSQRYIPRLTLSHNGPDLTEQTHFSLPCRWRKQRITSHYHVILPSVPKWTKRIPLHVLFMIILATSVKSSDPATFLIQETVFNFYTFTLWLPGLLFLALPCAFDDSWPKGHYDGACRTKVSSTQQQEPFHDQSFYAQHAYHFMTSRGFIVHYGYIKMSCVTLPYDICLSHCC